jgi:uncharacterized phage-associated protein
MTGINNITMAAGGKKNIERLVSIFQALCRETFDKSRWEHRLLLQKITYILGIKDKTFDYNFNWFVRGPYSPQLTREEYEYRESEIHKISDNDVKNVEFVRSLINKINEPNLELFASVYYLMKEYGMRNFEDIYFKIHASKPWFEKDDVKAVFDKINQHGLLA